MLRAISNNLGFTRSLVSSISYEVEQHFQNIPHEIPARMDKLQEISLAYVYILVPANNLHLLWLWSYPVLINNVA